MCLLSLQSKGEEVWTGAWVTLKQSHCEVFTQHGDDSLIVLLNNAS